MWWAQIWLLLHLIPAIPLPLSLSFMLSLLCIQPKEAETNPTALEKKKKKCFLLRRQAGRQTGGSAEDLSPLELLCYGICDELSPLTSRQRKTIASQIQCVHSYSPRQVLLSLGTDQLSQRAQQRRFAAIFRAGWLHNRLGLPVTNSKSCQATVHVSSPAFGVYGVCALDDSADGAVDTKRSPFWGEDVINPADKYWCVVNTERR